MKKDKCKVPKCNNIASMNYLGKRICEKCFEIHCKDNTANYLKEKLRIIK